MKLRFTEEESTKTLNRVEWTVYVEALVDGELVVCTPHKDADVLLSNLVVCESRVRDDSPTSLTPHTVVIDVLHLSNDLQLDSETEVSVVLWGIVDQNPQKVIEWRGFLPIKHWEMQTFDVLDEDSVALRMSINGYAVAKSMYSRATPRKWTGVRVSFNAAGVQRALDELIL